MSEGRHGGKRNKRLLIAGALVAVGGYLTAELFGVAFAAGWEAAVNLTPWGDESKASEENRGDKFPGGISVTYTNYAAPSAVFPDETPPPPGPGEDWEAWMQDHGGVRSHAGLLSLHFSAPSAHPVFIDAVRIERLECDDALPGAYLQPGGAGGLLERVMRVQLDGPETPPIADHYPLESTGRDWSFPLWIDQLESEVLAVVLDAYNGSYRLAVDVDFRFGDSKGTTRLTSDDGGGAIRFTGAGAATSVISMYAGQEGWSIGKESVPYLGEGSPLPAAEC